MNDLREAIRLCVDADKAFGLADEPAYGLIDEATTACRAALAANPAAAGALADAARAMVAWEDASQAQGLEGNTDWETYHRIVAACGRALAEEPPATVPPTPSAARFLRRTLARVTAWTSTWTAAKASATP